MRCHPLDLRNGVRVITCTSGRKTKSCSTPGCGGRGTQECDHPVKREGTPKVGDARLHVERKVIFYIRAIEGDTLKVSTQPPGGSGLVQTTTIAEWFAKTDATCSRAMCKRCAVRVGGLEYCAAHGRAAGRKV